jgi:hypothetical protein
MTVGDNVGNWFGVGDAALAFYGTLKQRWSELEAWGLGDKVPSARRDLVEWRQYAAAWDAGDEDETALRGWAASLRRVEEDAQAQGFKPAGPPVADVDSASLDSRVASHTKLQGGLDFAAGVARELAGDASTAATEAGGGLGVLWGKIPLGVKVGAGVGVAALAASQARPFVDAVQRWRDKGRR